MQCVIPIYFFRTIVKVGHFYVTRANYVDTDDKEILSALGRALSDGNLKDVQGSYTYIEPERYLYGKPPENDEDVDKIYSMTIDLILTSWSLYLPYIAPKEKFVVEISENYGRVYFYQEFS